MKLIIGLGNPGTPYTNTRHNAGFLALDFLAAAIGASFRDEKKFQASIAEGHLAGHKILLVKPLTFMNASGESVQKLLQFYKLTPSDIIVLHDDLDIAPGVHKYTASSRAAGHNGVASLIDSLGTQDFARLRIGIGRPTDTLGICMRPHDYVLAPFSAEEKESLENLFPLLQQGVESFLQGDSKS
jgi:PTH1 family peptidyl-tRNA hydrolase